MKRYKEPAFQERIAAAARARSDVLTQLREKPQVDADVAAARIASGLAWEAARQEKLRIAREAAKEKKLAKQTKALETAAARAALKKPEPTDAERKAARDARYEARKNASRGPRG